MLFVSRLGAYGIALSGCNVGAGVELWAKAGATQLADTQTATRAALEQRKIMRFSNSAIVLKSRLGQTGELQFNQAI